MIIYRRQFQFQMSILQEEEEEEEDLINLMPEGVQTTDLN